MRMEKPLKLQVSKNARHAGLQRSRLGPNGGAVCREVALQSCSDVPWVALLPATKAMGPTMMLLGGRGDDPRRERGESRGVNGGRVKSYSLPA